MRKCPYCAEEIQDEAIRCRYCGSDVRPGAIERPMPPPVESRVGENAIQFSHSGVRYLLGYGVDFFGIWDRDVPGGPVRKFPRTDDGWRDAWLEFVKMEPHHAAVGLASPHRMEIEAARRPPGQAAQATGRASGAWWILPILFGTLGGVIAWAVTRHRDPRMARAMLITGIALSVFVLFLYVVSGPR